MTTQFPVALDNFTNPTGTDNLGSSTVPHASQHANLNDAVEALETKVGIDASTDPTSLEYRVNLLETGGPIGLDLLSFDTVSPGAVSSVGQVAWNDTEGTLDLRLKGNNVTLQVGEELVQPMLNETAQAFVDGQVVRVTGAQGNRMTASLAQANLQANSSGTLGVVTEAIAPNQEGFVTVHGLVRDLNTSSFGEGDLLWLSSSVAGGVTNIQPVPPARSVKIGWCVRSHVTQGSIYVDVADKYPEMGWRDLIGDVTPKTTGVGAPTLGNLQGSIRSFFYSAGDDGDIIFHMPHDYVPGTDLFIHAHWSHNGTGISGSFQITFYSTYAKGHQQASFPAEITSVLTVSGLNVSNAPRYIHRVDEIQLSSVTPSGSLLDTAQLEPDGLVKIHYDVTAIPSITGGSPNEPTLETVDLHYFSNSLGTKSKAPNFYV